MSTTNATSQIADLAASQLSKIPGSGIILRYVRSSYQNDPVRTAIEAVLFLFAVWYVLSPSYSTKKEVRLSDEEIDDLVDEWNPESLTAPLTAFEEAENEKRPVIVGATGPKTKLSTGKTVINLASYNFYNFIADETIKERAIQVLRTYGVGPCGPPGFYGTQDVHIQTEADIAAHLGVPACIMYAQAFSTISSVIPCFSKRGDYIVADKACNYAIRKGIQISRSTVIWYEHNDLEDLERALAKVQRDQQGKPLTRRFIVSEGLFETVGDIADLPALIKLKTKYKFRLILDETWSYGVLGTHGKGLTEFQNVNPNDVDMLIGSLSGPLCANGGFCAGNLEMVEHQRITSAAYTFSAALPAVSSVTASETIRMRKEQPELFVTLMDHVRILREQVDPRSQFVRCTSSVDSPIMVLVFKSFVVEERKLTLNDQESLMQEIVEECLNNGVMITRLKGFPPMLGASARKPEYQPQAALKVCLTTGLTKKEVEKAGTTIRHAITKVMTKKK